MASMLEDKGAEFVTRWPFAISDQTGLGLAHIGDAVGDVTGTPIRERVFFDHQDTSTPIPQIGALTPAQAKAVVARLREIKKHIEDERTNSCWCCGTTLRNGVCRSCGDISI